MSRIRATPAVSAHAAGPCKTSKGAHVGGHVEGDRFVATHVEIDE